MKKKLLFAFFFLTLSLAYSQIKFEPGYIIEHNGRKIDVLIQNVDWKYNPTSINYRKDKNSKVEKASANEIKEFEVGNYHFLSATVNIDQSSSLTRHLSMKREPEFKEETVFLKYLVNGPANLYTLDRGETKYFFNKEGEPIEQLISKKYTEDGKILYNNQFRQQLFSNLRCEGMELPNATYPRYRKDSLIRYFVDFNSCMDEDFVYKRHKSKGDFNLSIKAGAGPADLVVERGLSGRGFEISDMEYRASVEFEYVLPFNRNKWSLYFEPAFRTFTGEQTVERLYRPLQTAQYTSVELGAGVRHYLFLNQDLKLFLNVGYAYDYHVKSEAYYSNADRNLDGEVTSFINSAGINIGTGLVFKNKYLIEAKYFNVRPFDGRRRDPENYFLAWQSNYSAIILMVGYRIF